MIKSYSRIPAQGMCFGIIVGDRNCCEDESWKLVVLITVSIQVIIVASLYSFDIYQSKRKYPWFLLLLLNFLKQSIRRNPLTLVLARILWIWYPKRITKQNKQVKLHQTRRRSTQRKQPTKRKVSLHHRRNICKYRISMGVNAANM